MLKSTKSNSRGFTLVELLIVIVVIAILAAISIVAYNGFQDRAKTSAGSQMAGTVTTKTESWNTIESGYPTHADLIGNDGSGSVGNPLEARLDNISSVIATAVDASTAQGGEVVTYQQCNDGATTPVVTGGRVGYWDYTADAIIWRYLGGAVAGNTCA